MFPAAAALASHLAAGSSLVPRSVRWYVQVAVFHPPWPRQDLMVFIAGMTTDARMYVALWLEKNYARLRRAALSLARTPEQADELVQQVALAALTTNCGPLPDRAFMAWCRKAMARDAIDWWRSSERATPVADPAQTAAFPEWGLHPSDPLEQAAAKVDIARALSALPEPNRWVVALVDVAGMDYQSAARVLGVPLGTVRSRLHRAHERLRRHLLG